MTTAASVRVGLDGQFLQQPMTGSGQYARQLWRHLRAGAGALDAVLLTPGVADTEAGPDVVALPPPPWASSPKVQKLWWEQRGVCRAARQARLEILHMPYFAMPRVAPPRTIVTIHDVIPLIFPEYGASLPMRLYLRLVVGAVRRATLIITDSACSRDDIVATLGIPADRIRVIPLAADEHFSPRADHEWEQPLRARYDLPGPMIFNVGGLDTRKNLHALIDAFALAVPELPAGTRLVIAGGAHSGNTRLYPPLMPLIHERGLDGCVVLTGPIDEVEKLALYRLADVYVYPSLYEGFGLSPLEAMACGTPVICSNLSSLPEVVGTGGLLVDPSPQRLAAALIAVLNDEQLRRDLAARGLEQARRFSWARTAEQTRAVYEDVANGGGR